MAQGKIVQQKVITDVQLKQALEPLKRQLANLKRENGRLRKLALEIKTLATEDLESKREEERLDYFKNQFVYVGEESQNYQFFRLQHGSKSNMDKTMKLITLQVKIQQFIAEFLQIPQTNYVLYYKDGDQVRRADIPPHASSKTIANIYAESGRRLIHLNSEAKRLLAEKKRSMVITTHFNNYAKDTKTALDNEHVSEKSYNMGHIAESFERHWQNLSHSLENSIKDDWTEEEIKKNFWLSKGNVSWWRSGDVKNKQVKWLDDSATVKTGSFTSIQELANYIVWLLEYGINEKDLDALTLSIAKAFTDSNAIEEYTEGSLARILASLQKVDIG